MRHPCRGRKTCWSSTCSWRSPRGAATSTRSTTCRGGSGSTGPCSRRRSTPPTTASSRTPSASYGLIETPLALDGAPPAALVLRIGEPTFPGCLIKCRAIGMYRMTDEAGGDDKVLCVPAADPRLEHMRDINHLPKFDRLEIEHFFTVYKELEPGKSVEGANWVGRTE